ncbi:DUF3883 domain-containing protein [Motilimonas eburnea]|uniref:DUF3883 domain-containing protein n=1 Tax=Motilimonas eburnea TaxID=1737488 RepID=UPI001E47CF9A|nr:DUF3883 domain-containing protein [Motilimonas eburnea]MCE2570538.1 DUF3883 domain-containing protein [Motilimonas eburnea]
MDDTLIPSTSEQWFEILTAEEEKTKNSYFAKPSNLIRDYRSEIATSNDYEGREILELLQNAADQAREAGIEGKVVIELLPEGILIANNGIAFSVGGVKSLQNAHLSPKRLREGQLIGCKGLGFRSILNWTNNPIILSGALALAYTDKNSQQKLEELKAHSSELAELVKREQAVTSSTILPTLPFPAYSESNDLEQFFYSQTFPIKERCSYWREVGYETVIGLPFEDNESFSVALQQLKSLRPEMLLFVDHLDEIKFLLPGEEERIWSKCGDDLAAMVLANDDPIGIWRLFRTGGLVDSEQLDKNSSGEYKYELVAAVPQVLDSSELKSSPLFSYFPTEIILPLPIVCHATLELDQSRNHLINCNSNQFVFTKLAAFLAEVAEECATDNPIGCNAGFRVVMPLEYYSEALNKFDLEAMILESCQSKSIVPTLCGSTVKPNGAFTIEGAASEWLPVDSFNDIVPVGEVELKWLRSLGVVELPGGVVRERICALKGLSKNERVALIVGLKSNNVSHSAYTPSLFLDALGESVPDTEAVYISPTGGAPTGLPDWVKLWFLDSGMQDSLSEKLDASDVRILQNKLKDFGLKEYSFARLIQDLRAQANKHKKVHPEQAENIESELLRVVYDFYHSEGLTKQRPTFPDKTSIELPNQAGSLVKSEYLYMGDGYGLNGKITQQLYSTSSDKLVVPPSQLSIELRGDHDWVDFLEWIGVAKWPREIKSTDCNEHYLDMVITQLRFPVRFGHDYFFYSSEELMSANLSLVSYVTLDGIDDILVPQKYTAILAWLNQDERVVHWLKRDKRYGTIEAKKEWDRNYRPYGGDVRSYIQWKLENTRWIRGSNNTDLRPKDCVITDISSQAIFPQPARMSDLEAKEYGMDLRDVVESWRKSGVATNVAELSLDDIYSKLLALPEFQPAPTAAKTLHRWMLNAIDSSSSQEVGMKNRFIQSGQMWGKKADSFKYFSIDELYHTDSDGLPPELLDRLAIVELPNRVGADKVKSAFGIRTIDRSAIKQTVDHFAAAPTNSDLNIYFQQVKPFFVFMRKSQSGQAQYIGQLNKLKLKVCSSLHVQMQFQDVDCSHKLPEWGWLIDGETLYVRGSDAVVKHDSDMLADVIGEALASLFRIANGSDFARLFRCHKDERHALLSRILGEEVTDVELTSLYASSDNWDISSDAVLPDIPVLEEPKHTNVTEGKGMELKVPDEHIDVPTTMDKVGNVGNDSCPIQITSVDAEAESSPVRQKLRVKKTRSSTVGKSSTSYTPVNGDIAEQKIMQIEESFEPPRYPLLVGQYMGYEGLGCDVISFSSEKDRDRFKNNDCRDLCLVDRFIEVKGRRNRGASIELRGNEKDAASKYANKYYLYRLYETSSGEYSLSILQNPLNDVDAIEHSLYVHMDRSKNREEFEVSTNATYGDDASKVVVN